MQSFDEAIDVEARFKNREACLATIIVSGPNRRFRVRPETKEFSVSLLNTR
jgi:hypothetical protein